MASEPPGFFSDPKTILALLAILLSVGNLIWFLANQHEQNRRWNKINAGSIELSKPIFQVFRQLTHAAYESTDVGYSCVFYGSPESADVLQQINFLRVRDKKTGALVPYVDVTFTVEQTTKELAKKGYKDEVIIRKVYRPIFYLKNDGKTEVNDFVVSVDMQSLDGKWAQVSVPSKPQKVPAGREVNISFDLEIELNSQLPEKIPFRISTKYSDINGLTTDKAILTTWFFTLNNWVYE